MKTEFKHKEVSLGFTITGEEKITIRDHEPWWRRPLVKLKILRPRLKEVPAAEYLKRFRRPKSGTF